jgi:hypothetical protein
MAQNTSTAVMQRRVEPHDSLDYFPTPLWATRALCEHVLGGKIVLGSQIAWDPACGEGHMARPLLEYFDGVRASDVHPYGFGEVRDFLLKYAVSDSVDWIITNPPFRLGAQFIEAARARASVGAAMLVRIAFLEGVGRYEDLFSKTPPNIIAQFVERVPMVKGRVSKEATTATAYCWLVWYSGDTGIRFQWIPPCRKKLEREGDYV